MLVIFCAGLMGQSAYVDSLQKIIALEKHDDAEMKASILLATDFSRSNPAKAKAVLDKMIPIANEANNYDRLCAAYTILLSLYQETGNADSADYCVSRLKYVASKAPDNNKVQTNYNQSLGLYYKKNGDFKSALPFALAAIKYAEEGKSATKAYIAGQWLNASNVYEGMGDYKNAMVCILKALQLFEEAGNKLGVAFAYTSISGLYFNLKQYKNALEYGQKSLVMKKSMGDKKGICTAEESIAKAYMGQRNFTEAMLHFDEALAIAKSENFLPNQATCYFNVARIYAEQKKDSLAIEYYKKCRTIAEQVDNKLVAANAVMELSVLQKNAIEIKQTEANLVKTLETFRETGSLDNEMANYKRMSEFYAANNDFRKALEYAKLYYAYKDSLSGINVQVQLNKLEAQYNTIKKENEISKLKNEKDLQLQKLQKQRLMLIGASVIALLAIGGIWLLMNRNKIRQQVKELELRNQLAADLHDEVGSSLSSIHMLSQMAVQAGKEENHTEILVRMSNNAKETVDKMGDIVWMIKPGESEAGNLKQRMERFAYEICGSKNINLKMLLEEVEKTKLSMVQRKNIYLIFKEAVNNAVKYSGAENMEISASGNNRQFRLEVKDSGKGFAESDIKRGNGLDNMKNRASDMGGKLEINSGTGRGTIIILTVPL